MRLNFFPAANDDPNTFTKIDPASLPPELQTLYKEMQADYTRKTSQVADERKQFGTERERYESQLRQYGAVEQEVNHWRQWYASLEAGDQAAAPTNSDSNGDVDDAVARRIAVLEQTIGQLNDKLQGVDATVKTTTDRTGRLFNYHVQLGDIMREHPEIDRDKLVQHAVAKGLTDLRAAYDDLYRDDIINAEVEKQLEEKLKEARATSITGVGRQVILRPASDAPKSFGEATQQILDDRAKAGTLDLGGGF